MSENFFPAPIEPFVGHHMSGKTFDQDYTYSVISSMSFTFGFANLLYA
jgi:hypothetical protein